MHELNRSSPNWLGLACVFGALSFAFGACTTTQSQESENEKWEVEILHDATHIGIQTVQDWPPPKGRCIDVPFEVEELPTDRETKRPANEVLLAFRHAGSSDGSIAINGSLVFTKVTGVDRIASAIADAVVEVTVCAIESALPGDPDCEPKKVSIKTTGVTRRFKSELLVVGQNTARFCVTSDDFLISHVRLTEATARDGGTETDAEANADDASPDSAADAR